MDESVKQWKGSSEQGLSCTSVLTGSVALRSGTPRRYRIRKVGKTWTVMYFGASSGCYYYIGAAETWELSGKVAREFDLYCI